MTSWFLGRCLTAEPHWLDSVSIFSHRCQLSIFLFSVCLPLEAPPALLFLFLIGSALGNSVTTFIRIAGEKEQAPGEVRTLPLAVCVSSMHEGFCMFECLFGVVLIVHISTEEKD